MRPVNSGRRPTTPVWQPLNGSERHRQVEAENQCAACRQAKAGRVSAEYAAREVESAGGA